MQKLMANESKLSKNLPLGKTRVPKNDRHKIHVILRMATQPFKRNKNND
jgi:hypothetical protein